MRVVGNGAVHPGILDPADVAEVSASLFALVNIIIENRIAEPKRVQAAYDVIPQHLRDAIAKRDKK